MNVASLELCQELYELSGWADCERRYSNDADARLHYNMTRKDDTPAYDLGYLLRKLPPFIKIEGNDCRLELSPNGYQGKSYTWGASYADIGQRFIPYLGTGDTPEDATCNLAVELIRRKIINPLDTPSPPSVK